MHAEERLDDREALIARLAGEGYLTDPRLEEAMLAVPRHSFLPADLQDEAYEDKPLPVGLGQTISAPHMVAMMTSALQVAAGDSVLEVGTGRGYHAAVLKAMAGDGEVCSIEFLVPLAQQAQANLDEAGFKVRVLQRDGAEGAPEFAPFDAVIVTCAIPEIPDALVQQLREGGHFVAPLGTTKCMLKAGIKRDGRLVLDDLGPCLFVNAQGDLGGDDMMQPAP